MSVSRVEITNYAQGAEPTELMMMENLLEQDPDNIALLEWVAFMHYTNNNFTRAIELYRRLTERDGGNEGHHYYLGNLWMKINEIPKALDRWKQVLEINPTSKFAEKARALIRQFDSQTEERRAFG